MLDVWKQIIILIVEAGDVTLHENNPFRPIRQPKVAEKKHRKIIV